MNASITKRYLLLKASALRAWVGKRRVKVAREQGKNGALPAGRAH